MKHWFPLICCVALAACGQREDEPRVAAPDNYAREATAMTQAPPASERESAEAPRPAASALSPLPSPEAISDVMITSRIRAALLADPGMAGADVSVNTDHGVVILAGTVKSHEQTGIASAYAQRQDGVMRVDNQLSLLPR